MDRRELLLAMLATADGRAFTPVQIQKSLFLLCRNVPGLVDVGPIYEFTPYDYGPFDASVYIEADALTLFGDTVISPSEMGRWNNYAASEVGVERGRKILLGLAPHLQQYVRAVSEWVRAQSFSGLVKSIYEAYPDMKVNSIFRG